MHDSKALSVHTLKQTHTCMAVETEEKRHAALWREYFLSEDGAASSVALCPAEQIKQVPGRAPCVQVRVVEYLER